MNFLSVKTPTVMPPKRPAPEGTRVSEDQVAEAMASLACDEGHMKRKAAPKPKIERFKRSRQGRVLLALAKRGTATAPELAAGMSDFSVRQVSYALRDLRKRGLAGVVEGGKRGAYGLWRVTQ